MKRIILTLTLTLFIAPFAKAQVEQRYANGTATDQDGNSYEWINYGTQDWAIENAEVVTYRDGTPIPQVTDATEWSNLTTGAWCYYDNDPTKGKLYNWYAVAGIHDNDENTPNKAFAPEGWHVTTDPEWRTLQNYLIENGYNYDGITSGNKIAKAMASTSGWYNSTQVGAIGNNQNLNNSSGFNALPEGQRNNFGSFESESSIAFFWNPAGNSTSDAWSQMLGNDSRLLDGGINYTKQEGFSVRYVRNASSVGAYGILLNGTVSVENNQIKNVADPTDDQDVVTKSYLVTSQSSTYSQQQVDQIISNLQEQINTLKAQSVNYGSNTFSSVIEVQNSLKPTEQVFTISDNTVSNTIQGINGTVININPNAITLNGNPYTGEVKATLDEYLTPNSMILSGIQTTSNGELLVTGGSFELDLEGENGEDLELTNWSTSASMPLAVNLSNDFVSAMRFYVGSAYKLMVENK